MPLSKSDRIKLLIKIADRLAEQDYSVIDLVLAQYGLPTRDSWDNTQNSYVLAMVKDADDDTVIGLAQHLEIPFASADAPIAPAELFQRAYTDPDALSIWTPSHLRLFISHKDTHKTEARKLADALKTYGISAFVAHDTIEPMTTWQIEIEKGLETMEVMLAFVTDDFHDSVWTNQEIGYALGKNVPIVSIKLERKSPSGFIGSKQALKGDLEHPDRSAPTIYKLLVENLGQMGRLRRTLIATFCASSNFNETRDRFDRLNEAISTLSDHEIAQIREAFGANDQLHDAYYLKYYDRLTDFMKRCTGKEYKIDGKELAARKIKARAPDGDDEIPF